MRHDVRVMQAMVDSMVNKPKFSYPSRQNSAPKPQDSFCHITLIGEYQVGIPENSIFEQTVDTTTYLTRSAVRLNFRVVFVNAQEEASMAMMGWTSEGLKQMMVGSGYGFVKCSAITNEDVLQEREWLPQMGMTVELYTERSYKQTVDNIKQLIIGGSVYADEVENYLGKFIINL